MDALGRLFAVIFILCAVTGLFVRKSEKTFSILRKQVSDLRRDMSTLVKAHNDTVDKHDAFENGVLDHIKELDATVNKLLDILSGCGIIKIRNDEETKQV